jgi:two-component system, chemotaxis family, protein-glutamate methylesterase/glutaminase
MRGHDIVVIGTSAGGVVALQEVFKHLPPDLPAAIFVVMHLTPHSPSFLPHVLLRAGRLPAIAVDKPMKFKHGHIYVAPPDHHLQLTRNEVRPNRGPRENWHRPSIDVMFRSAANAFGPRVAGVILTGFLDDGSAGLAAVKRKGGIAIVQDPEDAMYPDMPLNAIQSVKVDYCVPLPQIPSTIVKAVGEPTGRRATRGVSEEVAIENDIAKMHMNGRQALEKIGTPSTFTCPECQGPLWELKDGDLLRFRCQVGHAFSSETMLTAQQDVVERALWVALGAIQSRIALWRRISDRMKGPHLQELVAFYRSKEEDAQRDLDALRAILTHNGEPAQEESPVAARRQAGRRTAVKSRLSRSRRRDVEAAAESEAKMPRVRQSRTPGTSPQT